MSRYMSRLIAVPFRCWRERKGTVSEERCDNLGIHEARARRRVVGDAEVAAEGDRRARCHGEGLYGFRAYWTCRGATPLTTPPPPPPPPPPPTTTPNQHTHF